MELVDSAEAISGDLAVLAADSVPSRLPLSTGLERVNSTLPGSEARKSEDLAAGNPGCRPLRLVSKA